MVTSGKQSAPKQIQCSLTTACIGERERWCTTWPTRKEKREVIGRNNSSSSSDEGKKGEASDEAKQPSDLSQLGWMESRPSTRTCQCRPREGASG